MFNCFVIKQVVRGVTVFRLSMCFHVIRIIGAAFVRSFLFANGGMGQDKNNFSVLGVEKKVS